MTQLTERQALAVAVESLRTEARRLETSAIYADDDDARKDRARYELLGTAVNVLTALAERLEPKQAALL